ncbi:MAG: glycosyltransferase family 4 protein [Chloroflexota bacterium]
MITQKVDLDDDVLGFTHAWVKGLAERVMHLYVLALEVRRHELCDNVTLYSMGKEQGAGRLRRFVNFNQVVAPLLLRRQVDVVFVHMVPLYAILTALWAKLGRVPTVLWYAHGHVSRTLRIAHRLVERVVSSTPEGFRLPSQKLELVGQGIDTGCFKPMERSGPERPFTVLSVGRLSPVKDYETLILAADILIHQQGHNDMRFVVVGGAGTAEQKEYAHHLQKLAREHRLEAHVALVGSVPHTRVVQYYRQADVFVSTSRTGSLDKAALEAMACGLPVLACNEALAEMLKSITPKVVFEAGNAQQLSEKVADQLRLSAASRRSQGLGLRAVVERKHGLNGLVDRLVRVFEELV